MRIHVEGDIYISGNTMDYALEKKSITKEGKGAGNEVYTALGYHSTVSNCMKALLKRKISESTASDLKGLIDDVARIEAEIMTLIKF